MKKKAIVLYDNTCNVCIGTIKLLEKADDRKKLQFIPSNSPEGEKYTSIYQLTDSVKKTVVIIHDNAYLTKSDVGILILKILNKYKLLYYSLRLIPKPIRDFAYDLIAKHRHIFNKVTSV